MKKKVTKTLPVKPIKIKGNAFFGVDLHKNNIVGSVIDDHGEMRWTPFPGHLARI